MKPAKRIEKAVLKEMNEHGLNWTETAIHLTIPKTAKAILKNIEKESSAEEYGVVYFDNDRWKKLKEKWLNE